MPTTGTSICGLINQSYERTGVRTRLLKIAPVQLEGCASVDPPGGIVVGTLHVLKMYAAWYGVWDEYHRSFAREKLTGAIMQCGLEYDGKAHGALADAKGDNGVAQVYGWRRIVLTALEGRGLE